MDIPVGFEIIDATDMYGIPCKEIVIQCANQEIAELYLQKIIDKVH